MILERLVLENFRQFKGRQELVFSDLRERNVTIVHAENGFGKTTLLKALLWALYGRDGLMGADGKEEDFEKPDRIIHEGLAHRTRDPNAIAASVQLTFKHDTDRYILTRQISLAQQNLNPKQTLLTLEVMRDGQTLRETDNPQKRIQTIIPKGISGFLFFNGERINYLAMEKNSAQVTEAIHQMLGLELLRKAIEDLRHQSVRGRLRSEQKNAASEEKQVLIDRLSALETQIKELEERRSQTQKNLSAIAAELEIVDNKLDTLDRVIGSLPEPPHKAIFYCDDGRTTDAITEDEVRQIQAVARLLGEKHGLRVRNFTYRETPQEREEILRDLGSGFLDGVVAIRCLDEGIDLPELRMYISAVGKRACSRSKHSTAIWTNS